MGRLDRGDRATSREPARRYQRDTPGELIHVDVKKLAGIPPGGGWRVRGRSYSGEDAANRRVGYRYIHTAVDDRSRIVCSEILDNEQGVAAAGLWRRACDATRTKVSKTRPRRPQTNGKVERFHRILVEEWAYIRPRTSETERAEAYAGFTHFSNYHRAHGALGWAAPTTLIQDNLPEEHR